MMTDLLTITQETIQSQIYTIRGKQVMIDRDLAVLYGVETRVLNQAVKRNIERFPEEFMFRLNDLEFKDWVSQSVIPNNEKMGLRILPHVFTEQGIAMLSAILRSDVAIRMSIQIINAFVAMRKLISNPVAVFRRIETLEQKQFATDLKQQKADENFEKLFAALESGDLKSKQGIFYDGQVFDAYVFVSDLIRSAKKSIVLIDNYIDDTVLNLFTKRAKGISLVIYTQKISSQLTLDLQKHNAQYEHVVIKEFKQAHDRFLILDDLMVYHIGASLKDLGKKWFAFSKMEMNAADILSKLQFYF